MNSSILDAGLTSAEYRMHAKRILHLGHPNRLIILEILARRHGVSRWDLADIINGDESNVGFYLREMRKTNLVEPSLTGWVLGRSAAKMITLAFVHVFGVLCANPEEFPPMNQAERVDKLGRYYKALQRRRSLDIVSFLVSQKKSVGQRRLVNAIGLTQASTAVALQLQFEGGVIVKVKPLDGEGDRVHYRLSDYQVIFVETLRLLSLSDTQIKQVQQECQAK
ncbi:MAG TPA: hypothetical protein VNG90_02445 [Candidatus Acidoferrum sp.]|nr:hypothetical protein [Candidatus Acidoferrum sp.]